ncbi:MAG TPA: TonB-dependent receptor [Candidatus Aminicenantes bacterium]|nr:TonB-dependent receptor [Candidatus Aminicenantes bacterium]
MLRNRFSAVLLVLLLAAATAAAQVRTGVLTGRVLDDQGEPLPGVVVTITSPAMIQGTRAETTNDRGLYRFINLDPGVYALKAELPSFQTYEQEDIRVRLGLTSTVDVKLAMVSLQADIQVVAVKPLIDIESNRLSSNFTTEMLAKLPSARNMDSILQMAPGTVVVGDSRSAFGSGSRENYYSVDGTYLTDPGAGTQMSFWNYDIIEEAQIEGTGHDAQYGNASGAVINVITKSGGDRFSGLVNIFFRNKALRSDNHEGTGLGAPTDAVKNEWETSFNFGGPIKPGRVWFFVSGNLLPTDSETVGFPDEIQRRQAFGFGKLTAQLNPKNRLSLVYNYSRDRQNHMYASQFRTPESTLNSLQWTSTFNLQWNSQLGSNTLLEVRAAHVDRSTSYNSNGDGPQYYEMTTGMMTGSAGFRNTQTRHRNQGQGSLTHWVDRFLGSHDLKVGFDYERGAAGYDGTNLLDDQGRSSIYLNNGALYMWLVEDPAHVKKNDVFYALAGYAQDTWKLLSRLTVNAGVRLNAVRNVIPKQYMVPEDFTEFRFTNLEPRLGLVYDISTRGRQMALKAHYGRYYINSMALGLSNPNARTRETWFNWNGTPYLLSRVSPTTVTVDPDLRRPYSDSFLLGFEISLLKNLALKVNGIYKTSEDFIGLIDLARTADWYDPRVVDNPIAGGTLTVFNRRAGAPLNRYHYTNPPQADRAYKAIQFVLEKSLSAHFQFLSSFTYSRAVGLVSLGTLVSGGMTTTSLDWTNPNMYVNTRGRLDLDKPCELKFSGVYFAPLGFVLGVNYIGQSGAPYGRSFRVNLNQGLTSFYGEIPGSQRTPFQHLLDVRLEKTFRAGRFQPKAFVEVFNLTNANTALGIGATLGTATYGQITSILPPRTVRLGVGTSF